MKHYFTSRTQHMGKGHFEPNPFNVIKVAFSPKAFERIKKTIGSLPAESGGALFGKPEELNSAIPYIREFVFDHNANTTRATYTINTKHLNPIIHQLWEQRELELQGLVHSHPYGCQFPSGPDVSYFHDMLTYMERPFLITPIIFTEPDGGFKMFCYLVGSDTPAYAVDCCIMDEKEYEKAIHAVCAETPQDSEVKSQEDVEDVEAAGAAEEVTKELPETLAEDTPGIDYSREADAVDIDLLRKTKIVIVGTGGFYEGAGMLARSGVGKIVAIDPDVVDATNICRQGYMLRQVGKKKVDALGEHVNEINPDVKFSGFSVKVQDLTPEQEKDIFADAGIAIFTTDSFEAQAYGNIIALRYGIPAIWGGFYEKSLASEIVFYIPEVTPGCFRCAVSPRYRAQEEYKSQHGKEYGVSSNCNTIFHSAFLDAQIGMLVMAIIHNKVEGKVFYGWFGDKFDRNLIQTNVNPLYESNVFKRTFGASGDSAFLFETVWQHIEPEVPPKYELCPDCHGGVNHSD